MNKSLVILLLLFNNFSSLNNQTEGKVIVENDNKTEVIVIDDDLYNLQIKVKSINGVPSLVIAIALHKGAHFVSPNEKKKFTGKFYMDLGSYNDIEFKGSILEKPLSKIEVCGPYPVKNVGDKNVRNITSDTTYTQPLNVKSQEDFEVFRRIQFTIEPRCTFEEIPFGIRYKNGKFSVFNPKC